MAVKELEILNTHKIFIEIRKIPSATRRTKGVTHISIVNRFQLEIAKYADAIYGMIVERHKLTN